MACHAPHIFWDFFQPLISTVECSRSSFTQRQPVGAPHSILRQRKSFAEQPGSRCLPLQTDISVAQAIQLWPKLEAAGLRLGAPAVSSNAQVPSSWLGQFMSQVSLRVRFFALKVLAQICGAAAS